MTRFKEILAVSIAAGALTLGLTAAEAQDMKLRGAISKAPISDVASAEKKAEVGQAAAEKIVQTPECRKVKVVYAGYGESDRAGCPAK